MPPKRILSSKQRDALKEIRTSFINGLTVDQINTYIDNQITDLASARAFLKKLSKVVLYILRHSNLQ